MPGIADAELLLMFSALTGMSPDGAIPAYLRVDANLFFTNLAVFRGMLLSAAALAPAAAPLLMVAPTTSASGLPSVSPPLDFVLVSGKHKTAHHHQTTQFPIPPGFHPGASSAC